VIPGQTSCLQINSNGQCTQEADTVPLLRIDSSGHLDGLNAVTTTSVNTFETGAMTSAATVNDGAWHQAVVIPGRALYLDGKQVATGSGKTLTLPAPANTNLGDFALLGAGLTIGSTAAARRAMRPRAASSARSFAAAASSTRPSSTRSSRPATRTCWSP
jgi:hypothetical protein